jgi:hypothetical protein
MEELRPVLVARQRRASVGVVVVESMYRLADKAMDGGVAVMLCLTLQFAVLGAFVIAALSLLPGIGRT